MNELLFDENCRVKCPQLIVATEIVSDKFGDIQNIPFGMS